MLTDEEFRTKGPPKTYDNTMLCQWDSCPRKLYWFLRGADYAGTPAYFTFGKAWQEILCQWHSIQRPIDLGASKMLAHMDDSVERGRECWTKDSPLPHARDNFELLVRLFQFYVQEYPKEEWVMIESELGFEWPLAGTPYYLAGSVDGYIDWQPHGHLLLENKTVGVYLNDAYVSGWEFSTQVTQYIWALSQLKGEEVFGCLMNMATKRIPKTKSPTNAFARSLEQRSTFQLDEYVRETLLLIHDITREWDTDRWDWPKCRNHIECVGGIGKSVCLFRGLCRTEDTFWKLNPLSFPGIASREGEWTPWERQGGS